MTATNPKEKRRNLIQYLLKTETEELFEDGKIEFAGETEKERNASAVRFTRIRGMIQRYNQSLTPDDNETLILLLAACVVQKQMD